MSQTAQSLSRFTRPAWSRGDGQVAALEGSLEGHQRNARMRSTLLPSGNRSGRANLDREAAEGELLRG